MQKVFTYDLPSERIAQRPVYPYDQAKLLVLDRQAKTISETVFSEIGNYLSIGDCLVFNNSRVLPARLFGQLQPGGAEVEVLLLKCLAAASATLAQWTALARPLKKLTPGREIAFSEELRATVVERLGEKEVLLDFRTNNLNWRDELSRLGCMPIPPYIRKGRSDAQDNLDYQSNFAKQDGSVAAPTASLHFTPELLQQLKQSGLLFEELTLHVGPASFFPVYDSESNEAGTEPKFIPPAAESLCLNAQLQHSLSSCRNSGGKIVAVGTTVVRALETLARVPEFSTDLSVDTDIFIKPGHQFLNVDAVVTNFHQPGTSHMLLVEALLGRELLQRSYQYALDNDFRFLSYGDAMLIL